MARSWKKPRCPRMAACGWSTPCHANCRKRFCRRARLRKPQKQGRHQVRWCLPDSASTARGWRAMQLLERPLANCSGQFAAGSGQTGPGMRRSKCSRRSRCGKEVPEAHMLTCWGRMCDLHIANHLKKGRRCRCQQQRRQHARASCGKPETACRLEPFAANTHGRESVQRIHIVRLALQKR